MFMTNCNTFYMQQNYANEWFIQHIYAKSCIFYG